MKSILVFASVFATGLTIAQDFSGFLPMNNLLDHNPAFAGSNGGFRAQGNYLNKWPNLSGRTVFTSLSADAAVNRGRSGLSLYNKRTSTDFGAYVNNSMGAGYAHRFSLAEGKIKLVPSAQVEVINAKLDLNALSFSDMRGKSTPNYVSKTSVGINTGVLLQFKEKFSIGFASYHVNTPDIGVLGASYLPTRTVLHASYNFINENKQLLNLFGAYSYQNGQSAVTAVCSAIFKKHLYAVVGSKVEAIGFDVNTGFGWRSDFWSAMLCYNRKYFSNFGFSPGSFQLCFSYSMRAKEHIHGLSALENW